MKNFPDIISSLDTKDILNNSHDAFIITDSEKLIRFVNRAAVKIFGYAEDELIGQSILFLMSEERTENYIKQMKEVLSGKIVSNIDSGEDLRGKRKSGEIFPIELTYVVSRTSEENYFISQIRDISDRTKKENELSVTSTALKIINETNRLLIRSESEKEYIQGICDIITKIGGYSKSLILYIEEIENDKLLVPAAYSGYSTGFGVKQSFRAASIKHSGSPTIIAIQDKKTNVCRNIKACGLWKYWKESPEDMEFDSTISVPVVQNDEVIGILRVYSYDPLSFDKNEVDLFEELSKDISHGIKVIRERIAHKDTVKKLEESENKYRILFQSSNDAIFIANAENGIIIDANKQAEELLGRGLKEIIGMHHLELHPETYEEKFRKIFKEHVEQGLNASDEFYIRTKNGKAIPVHVSASVSYINGQKVIQGIFRDISKSKMEEDKIRAAQKMEALGTLSGGIAHDINNILSPIIGFTQIAMLETDNIRKQSECLNEVLTAANRAKELVSQILTFSRKSDSEKKPHRIHNIVKEVLKLISLSMPKNIKLETVIDENAEPILCDPVQIYQVVINLCTNAFHAMKENGGILRVGLVRKGSKEIKIEDFEKLPENYICLIVSDTGCGMSKTTLNRIFEPYFTTKSKEEGTGLGLSVVSGIVKEHEGEIYTRTYPNEGTYFRITFPIVKSKTSDSRKSLNGQIKTENPIHIMAVDDEPQITFMLKFMLEEIGHTSDTFTDPQQALDSFTKNPSKYDLVITDQTMPGILGTELSRKMLEVRPDIPIILNTGYSPIASKIEADKIGIKQFLMKPLTISDISFAIHESVSSKT